MEPKPQTPTPGMNRQVSLLIDGQEFTLEEALSEAKNCYGIGNGVTLLAEQLTAGLLTTTGRDQCKNDPKAYIKACIASAIYETYLTGAVLLTEMNNNHLNHLHSITSEIPESELKGNLPEGSTSEDRFFNWMRNYDAICRMRQDTSNFLQKLTERGYGGSFEFSQGTDYFNFDLKV